MLKKLFHYDNKALAGKLLPVQLAIIAGSLLAGGCLAYNLVQGEAWSNAMPHNQVLSTLLSVVMVLLLVAIAASALITMVLICIYFYRNLFCDEGYLTFTLPVTTSQIIWSKVLAGFVWTLINLLAVCLGMAIFLGIGFSPFYGEPAFAQTIERINAALTEIETISGNFHLGLYFDFCIVCSLISAFCSLVITFFAIVAACIISHRHRVLVALGLLFGISFVASIVSSIATALMSADFLNDLVVNDTFNGGFLYGFIGIQTLIVLLLGAGAYFWMHRLLHKKLNLD